MANAGQGPRPGWKADLVMKRKLKNKTKQNTQAQYNTESRRTRSWEKHRQPQLYGNKMHPTERGTNEISHADLRTAQQPSARARLVLTPNLAPALTIRRLSKETFKAGQTQLCTTRPGDSTWWTPTTAHSISVSPPASTGDHQHAEWRVGF